MQTPFSRAQFAFARRFLLSHGRVALCKAWRGGGGREGDQASVPSAAGSRETRASGWEAQAIRKRERREKPLKDCIKGQS